MMSIFKFCSIDSIILCILKPDLHNDSYDTQYFIQSCQICQNKVENKKLEYMWLLDPAAME